MLRNPYQHLWANLLTVVKSEDKVRITGSLQYLVRAGCAFDGPADLEKRL